MTQGTRRYLQHMVGCIAALTFILLCSPLQVLYAQEGENDDSDFWKDLKITYIRSPTLSLYYGGTTPGYDGFTQNLARSGFLQIKIGGSTVRPNTMIEDIVRYRYEYVDISTFAPRLTSRPSAGEVVAETWRFGLSAERGMGYGNPAKFSFLLYNGGGLNWSRISVRDQLLTPENADLLGLYRDSFRFGTLAEGGIKVRLTDMLIVDGAYERAMIYPRHLFWKWAGSGLLELCFQWGVDGFVDKVLKNSPAAAPIVSFVLKNGVSYAVYEVRKKQMYWPFASDPAILNDTWKVGVSMTF